MSGSATFATARLRLATAATRISAVRTRPDRSGVRSLAVSPTVALLGVWVDSVAAAAGADPVPDHPGTSRRSGSPASDEFRLRAAATASQAGSRPLDSTPVRAIV